MLLVMMFNIISMTSNRPNTDTHFFHANVLVIFELAELGSRPVTTNKIVWNFRKTLSLNPCQLARALFKSSV